MFFLLLLVLYTFYKGPLGGGGASWNCFFNSKKVHVKRQHFFIGTVIKAHIHYTSSGMSVSPHLCNVMARGVY